MPSQFVTLFMAEVAFPADVSKDYSLFSFPTNAGGLIRKLSQ